MKNVYYSLAGMNYVIDDLAEIIKNKMDSKEEIKKIKIKNEDFIYKRITIILNDGTKYVMNCAKKIKGANYHQENLNKFIEIYK